MPVEITVNIVQSFQLTDEEYDDLASQATKFRVSVEELLTAETSLWWDRLDDPYVRVEIDAWGDDEEDSPYPTATPTEVAS